MNKLIDLKKSQLAEILTAHPEPALCRPEEQVAIATLKKQINDLEVAASEEQNARIALMGDSAGSLPEVASRPEDLADIEALRQQIAELKAAATKTE